MKKYSFFVFLALFAFSLAVSMPAMAEEGEINEREAGATASQLNSAKAEKKSRAQVVGQLVEIGNTTSDNTTIVVRPTNKGIKGDDKLIEVTKDTKLTDASGKTSSLSDWIPGDMLIVKASRNENSEEIVALDIKNNSLRGDQRGVNGWIQEIKAGENKIVVKWGVTLYTLNLASAKIVAGYKASSTIADLKVGDRVRTRVADDKDGNKLTWNANILLVLKRGDNLFMKVTRWVIPAKIVSLPTTTGSSTIMSVEVLTNRFYKAGDANSLIGKPGDIMEVKITDKTELRRRFLGKSLLSEFSEGDHLNIVGRMNETTGQLDALVIKNNSIQAANVPTKVGAVVSVDSSANKVTAQLNNGQTYTVTANSETKVYRKDGEKKLIEIKLADIQKDEKIRTRGILNRQTKNIAAKVIVVWTKPVEVAK